MKRVKKAWIITGSVILGIVCIAGGCVNSNMRKKEEQARQEEIMAGYPEEIKAYLEEKYGREFCVSPEWESMDNGPVPFAPPSYVPYTYLAWEDEEDGYAFWTKVYPESLENKEIREIRDNYCWKFISEKIKEELGARLEGTVDNYKMVVFPFAGNRDEMLGEEIDQNSELKDALQAMDATAIDIWVYVSPEARVDEGETLQDIEKIVSQFYDDFFRTDLHNIYFIVKETYTEEDFLKIEPEKIEQYHTSVIEESKNDKEITIKCINKMMLKYIRGG